MTKQLEADWNTWAFIPSVTLQDAVFLSLDLGPAPQGFNHALLKAYVHAGKANPIEVLQEFNRRMKIASANIHELAGSRAVIEIHKAKVPLSKFGAWAERIGWSLPDKFPRQTDQPIDATNRDDPAPVTEAAPALPPTVIHSTKKRRDSLTPVIELAQAQCRNPNDTAEVWGALLALAEKKTAPLIGATEEGLQYLKKGTAAILTRDALDKRLGR